MDYYTIINIKQNKVFERDDIDEEELEELNIKGKNIEETLYLILLNEIRIFKRKCEEKQKIITQIKNKITSIDPSVEIKVTEKYEDYYVAKIFKKGLEVEVEYKYNKFNKKLKIINIKIFSYVNEQILEKLLNTILNI